MAVTIKRNRPLNPWEDKEKTPYIEIESVTKSFDDHHEAVSRVSLSIYEGEFFSLLGPSGCGKTTLLRLLAGFETPTSGKIFIDGVDISQQPPYKRPVNMMFQSYALFPHMSVYDNIAFGLQFDNLSKAEVHDRVYEVLDLVQMKHYIRRKPHELSGGQRQRVALARSLAKHPKLILLDEPMAALDRNLREDTQFELVDIQERVGITFIMVTHDQEEAMTMSSRVAIMQEGAIVQVGTPHEIYEFPHSQYVADFIGTVNIFEGIVTGQSDENILIDSNDIGCKLMITCTATVPIGSHVSIALRPEKIIINKQLAKKDVNATKGTVKDIAYLGDMSIYHIELETGKVVQASMPNLYRLTERDVTWEDEVYISWKPENGVVLTS
ncbi:MAG: polyamine ABC transporter ATP-binding protein [Alphaproteobacteria bacterium]|nr:MAG: polyamine ABC transporter ATP-binding protein [Alphaproteobacteria bacterium]